MENQTEKVPEQKKKPYKTPEVTDFGTLAQETQTRPRGGGGLDFGSS